jgi:hypothetical protein
MVAELEAPAIERLFALACLLRSFTAGKIDHEGTKRVSAAHPVFLSLTQCCHFGQLGRECHERIDHSILPPAASSNKDSVVKRADRGFFNFDFRRLCEVARNAAGSRSALSCFAWT